MYVLACVPLTLATQKPSTGRYWLGHGLLVVTHKHFDNIVEGHGVTKLQLQKGPSVLIRHSRGITPCRCFFYLNCPISGTLRWASPN